MQIGNYNLLLVATSLLIAILATYIALDMAGRISAAKGKAARWWLVTGATVMGVGIWSMHFVGMLAYTLPIQVKYDLGTTLLSLAIAIVFSSYALWKVCQDTFPRRTYILSALTMGIGIVMMHYTGMAAMRMNATIRYIPFMFAISVLIAIAAAGAALGIAFQLRRQTNRSRKGRVIAAVVMGIGITGMHYTAIAATCIPINEICGASEISLKSNWSAVLVSTFCLAILSIVLMTSISNRKLTSWTSLLNVSLHDRNKDLTDSTRQDTLTKLPNKVFLKEHLSRTLALARLSRTRFSVMFIDLDGFKRINETYSQQAGDQILIELSHRILSNIREEDTLARVEGDEFVLVTTAAKKKSASLLAEKLIQLANQPFLLANEEVHISASIGIALYENDASSDNDLISNADAAMCQAKLAGKNTYCFFDSQLGARLQEDLSHALGNHELLLQYQPKFDAVSTELTGLEALIRWKHPLYGLIAPDKFIPLAEKTGLIIPIGNWVLDEACKQLRKWHTAGHTNWTIAVNLSSIQFSQTDFFITVQDTLKRYSLEPYHLVLEVTESIAMQNIDISTSVLQKLHEMGVRISIDDFGTGYSSLLYLKRLPASEIKIDRAFVRDLIRDSDDAAIISAIVAIGRALNLKVVAEGVETQEQQEFLTQLGCTFLQGFLLGRPMSAEQITRIYTASAVNSASIKN